MPGEVSGAKKRALRWARACAERDRPGERRGAPGAVAGAAEEAHGDDARVTRRCGDDQSTANPS